MSDYTCQAVPQTDRIALCIPEIDHLSKQDGLANSFYAVVHGDQNIAEAISEIKRRFKNITGAIVPSSPKGDINIPTGAKAFDVTDLVPKFIRDNIFRTENYAGPNCYATALTAAGIITGAARYVDDLEFSYYLTRDFRPASMPETLIMGAVVTFSSSAFNFYLSGKKPRSPIEAKEFCHQKEGLFCYRTKGSHFSDRPSSRLRFGGSDGSSSISPLYRSGEHAAFTLPSGFVFHKLTWRRDHRYEVLPLQNATKSLDYAVWEKADRLERSPYVVYQTYSKTFYVKKDATFVPQARIQVPAPEKKYLMTMFNFYSELIERASSFRGEDDFNAHRLNLLTMENIWAFCETFEKKHIRSVPSYLLNLETDVAEAYLKLRSLSWQYEAIKETYTPKSRGNINEDIERRKELYRNSYLYDLQTFKAEAFAHMAARGVPAEARERSYANIMEKIKERMPTVVDAASMGVSVDFYTILNETLKQQ